MLGYYLRLGVRQLRRSPLLTGLIIVTLAVGVAAASATLTILYMMGSDPIPQKSDRLLTLTLDIRPPNAQANGINAPNLLTWPDVSALRAAGEGLRRTGLYGVSGILYPEREGQKNESLRGVAVDADFFALFDAPFLEGGGWRADDDLRAERVIVLSRGRAERLFGDGPYIGRELRLDNERFRVVGVLDRWPLRVPNFYRLDGSSRVADQPDDFYLPLTTALAAERFVDGTVNCHSERDPGFAGLMASDCTWMRYWVEVAQPRDREALRDHVAAHVVDETARGRFHREEAFALYDVREWLEHIELVDNDTRLQTALAFGFLAVCLINTIGLLLAKFTARAGEIGVRRALGASRGQIVLQYLCEAAVLGLAGSLLGLFGAWGMLQLLAQQSPDLQAFARMDGAMLAVTVLLSVGAALLAGLLPTWRAAQVVPALQLKSQ